MLEKFCWKLLFWKFSIKISDVFFQGQTLFWPYLRNGWSDWCETKRKCIGCILGTICDLERWPHSPLDVSRSNLEKALYHRNCWSDWCEMKRKLVNMILGRLYDLALWPHPWPCPCSFKVRVWNSFISGIGRPIDNDRQGCESSIHDHDIDLCDHGGMYRIVTRVTSDVSVPSTYLVYLCLNIKHFDVES